MWVRGQDENTAIICKGWQIFKTTKSRDMWTGYKIKLAKNLAETGRKEIPTKMIDRQIPCNKCNMQFVHLPLSGANL